MNTTTAALWSARLFVERTLLARRSLLIAGLVIADLVIAMIWRSYSDDEDSIPSFEQLTRHMLFGFVLPFTALHFGTAVIRDEADSGTITYLLARPISRNAFLLGRSAASVAVVLIVSASVALGNFAILDGTFSQLLPIAFALMLGSLAYTAVFVFLSSWLQRPFLVGLLLLLFFEFTVSQIPASLRFATLRAHLENVAGFSPEILGLEAGEPVTAATSVITALVVSALLTLAASLVFSTREFTAD